MNEIKDYDIIRLSNHPETIKQEKQKPHTVILQDQTREIKTKDLDQTKELKKYHCSTSKSEKEKQDHVL